MTGLCSKGSLLIMLVCVQVADDAVKSKRQVGNKKQQQNKRQKRQRLQQQLAEDTGMAVEVLMMMV